MRLKGTLPLDVLEELRSEREAMHNSGNSDEDAWLKLYRRQFSRIDAILDAAETCGRRWLTEGEIPRIILDSLDWLKNEAGWSFLAATVMSTHIHIVMRNGHGRSGELFDDIERFKRFTGRAANKVLDREGRFWAREEFDHWCRTPEKVEGAVRYVRQNPVQAGLVNKWQDWPWTVGDGV
jgi:REP element-mobilizing transposase RayT